jgi:hypothetical protein
MESEDYSLNKIIHPHSDTLEDIFHDLETSEMGLSQAALLLLLCAYYFRLVLN